MHIIYFIFCMFPMFDRCAHTSQNAWCFSLFFSANYSCSFVSTFLKKAAHTLYYWKCPQREGLTKKVSELQSFLELTYFYVYVPVCEIQKERAVKSKRKTLNSYLQRSILKRSFRVISILGCELKELELILVLS